MKNKLIFGFLICCMLTCNGCVVTLGLLARRCVVKDDVVLVKENNVLYKRYISKGALLKGNKKLINKVGPITSNNEKIKVFKNYQAALDSGIKFTVDPDSKGIDK